jgi:serine phosphatase RsbU (regulator of sigma subunit)
MKNQEPAYFNLGLSSDQDQTKKNYFSMFPEEIIASVLDAFIINQPMTGSAGGDGFWVHQEEEFLYIAVFDCMGHGHLASMMTRVYTKYLEKVVKYEGVKDPGTILRYLHHQLMSKFNEKSNMQLGPAADVGIIKVNIQVRQLEFSGARMSLLQVEDGKVKEVKGNRFQVGDMYEYSHDYTSTSVELKAGSPSNIYLMSDGLKDLMGGFDGKKLSSKGVNEILKKIHSQPMVTQKDSILREIKNWQGSMQQYDDILILGFKI